MAICYLFEVLLKTAAPRFRHAYGTRIAGSRPIIIQMTGCWLP